MHGNNTAYGLTGARVGLAFAAELRAWWDREAEVDH